MDEPLEAELLIQNLQTIDSELVSDLKDSQKAVEDSILKCEELINHYETLLQDKQVAFEALEHQLKRAKARVYDLDIDLKATQYEVCKLDNALEVEQHQQGFQAEVEAVPQVNIQRPKREVKF